MEKEMVESVRQVVSTSLRLAIEAGWTRNKAKEYTWRNILESTNYDRLNDNEKNYVRSIYGAIMYKVWPRTPHKANTYPVQITKKIVHVEKPEISSKEKQNFGFTNLYEHIAKLTGRLPDDKIGNAIATFFEMTNTVAGATRKNMANKGYCLTKRDDGSWDATPPKLPDSPEPKIKMFSEDEVRQLFDEFLKSKGLNA